MYHAKPAASHTCSYASCILPHSPFASSHATNAFNACRACRHACISRTSWLCTCFRTLRRNRFVLLLDNPMH